MRLIVALNAKKRRPKSEKEVGEFSVLRESINEIDPPWMTCNTNKLSFSPLKTEYAGHNIHVALFIQRK